jgi:5-formyltetrahydrofolate cyclo-ligase
MNLLRVYNAEDLQSLPSGTWGIKEPSVEWTGGRRIDSTHSVLICLPSHLMHLLLASVLDDECERLDLILVPGPFGLDVQHTKLNDRVIM